MAEAYRVELTPEFRALLRSMQRLPQEILVAIAKGFDEENQETISHIIQNYANFPKDGPPMEIGLRSQGGYYRKNLHAFPAQIGDQRVESAIGSNLKYAAIHEFGGTIPAHKVTAKNGKALRFQIGDRVIFRRSVNIPEVTMPARRPIQRGIEDRLKAYAAGVCDAAGKAWEKLK